MRLIQCAALGALLVAPACLGARAQRGALLPAAQMAWANVQADFEAGVTDGVRDGDLSDPSAVQLLSWAVDMRSALDSSDLALVSLVPWEPTMRPWADRGIQAAVEAGELGPNGAGILRQRVENFTVAWRSLSGRDAAVGAPRPDGENPYVITPTERRAYDVIKESHQ